MCHYRYLANRYPGISLESVHRVTRVPHWTVGVSAVVLGCVIMGNLNAEMAWHVPIWFSAISNTLLWTVLFLAMSYAMSLGVFLAWQQKHRQRIPLSAASGIMLGALLFLHFRLGRLPELSATGELTADGYYLQTTGASCAAASGANIARVLGIKTSEAEMVKFMSTSGYGTSDGQIVIGMKRAGIVGRRVAARDTRALTAPAMLFIDHEDTGPESHAIALISNTNRLLHVVDPLIGSLRVDSSTIDAVWHGRAIEFRLTEQSVAE